MLPKASACGRSASAHPCMHSLAMGPPLVLLASATAQRSEAEAGRVWLLEKFACLIHPTALSVSLPAGAAVAATLGAAGAAAKSHQLKLLHAPIVWTHDTRELPGRPYIASRARHPGAHLVLSPSRNIPSRDNNTCTTCASQAPRSTPYVQYHCIAPTHGIHFGAACLVAVACGSRGEVGYSCDDARESGVRVKALRSRYNLQAVQMGRARWYSVAFDSLITHTYNSLA